jgi:hypothetical protein
LPGGVCDGNAGPSCHFFQRVDQRAVAIGRHGLKYLHPIGGGDDDAESEEWAFGICKAEQRANEYECNNVFEMRETLYRRPH